MTGEVTILGFNTIRAFQSFHASPDSIVTDRNSGAINPVVLENVLHFLRQAQRRGLRFIFGRSRQAVSFLQTMKARHFAALLAVACLFLAGCLPESKNPLSSPANSLYDAHLEGDYRSVDKDGAGFWHFRYRRENHGKNHEHEISPWIDVARVGYSKDRSLERENYKVLATQIAGRKYLSFIRLPDDGSKKRPIWYGLARYEVNWRGDLRIWLASESAFVAAVKAGKLSGKVTPGKYSSSAELTDTTEHLAAFVAAGNPQDLFNGEPMVLRRIAR
jgi:hypothetical protein